MKWYIQFMLLNKKKDTILEAVGSDSVFMLDGRNNLETMALDGIEQMRKLQSLHPEYMGFDIIKGLRISNDNQVVGMYRE